jgi:hypothetical protein
MKALLAKPLLALMLIVVFTFSKKAYSQADSTRVTYSFESSDSSDYNYRRKYEYLDINLKDETSMFKIAIPTFTITYYNNLSANSLTQNNFGLLFSFERKINPSWSVYVEDENDYSRIAYLNINGYNYSSIINWGIRYYFLIKKRIKDGVSGNNCNGVFVDFLVSDLNGMGYSKIVYNATSNSDKFIDDEFKFRLINKPELRLNIGLQKRLNNFSYIDTRVYMSYTPEKTYYYKTDYFSTLSAYEDEEIYPKIMSHFIFGLDFKIGLGWGWK